jgi:hypothetical protein
MTFAGPFKKPKSRTEMIFWKDSGNPGNSCWELEEPKGPKGNPEAFE